MIGSSSLFILSFQVFTLYCTLSLYSLFTFSQRFSLWVTLSLRFLPATCLPLVGSYTELKIWLFSAGRISLCLKTCYSFILNHSHEKEMCNFNLLSTALQSYAAINCRSSWPTLSYFIASLIPKHRPSCADTITSLGSEWGRKDSRVLASRSRLWGSGSLQQRSAGT